MWKTVFEVPGLGFRLHSYSLLLLIACASALFLAAWRARRERLDPESIYELAVWLFSGGFLGARIWFFVQNPGALEHWTDLLRVWNGGVIFYGCIVGGLTGSILFWLRHRFPFLATADAVAPSLALGIALGRIGCFLNGCCFGSTCDLPWAVRFPAGSLAWGRHVQAGWIPPWAEASLPVHPKQLYLALEGFLLLALLWAYFPRRKRDGEVIVLLMVGYSLLRFATEFLRGDADGWYGPFTISQYLSLGILALGLVFWMKLPRRRRIDEHGGPIVRRPWIMRSARSSSPSRVG
jgi:phosphatidylglycerol:prolipoprotein diacylglycerol transferase